MKRIQFTDCIELVGNACSYYEGEKKYISTGTIAVDKIDADKVEYLHSKVDIDSLINSLNQSKEICYKSTDAGEYICNYLYFEVLNNHSNQCIFVHIPNYQTVDEYIHLNDFLLKLIKFFD